MQPNGCLGLSMADEDLSVDDRHVIPAAELEWRFSTSGGPGGQHANRSNTRAELRFDLGSSLVFTAEEQSQMLGEVRNTDGVINVVVDESRSQFRNRQIARRRLIELLQKSLIRPTPRRATKPSRRQRQARLTAKKHRAEVKKNRRTPEN